MLFILLNIILVLVVAIAIRFGGRPERHGAIWFIINCAFQLVLTGSDIGSPTMHLLADGIYATGLIPLAYFHMSYWIGAVAILVCGSFTLQSIYLCTDQPADMAFGILSNVVTCIQLVAMLVATAASYLHRRRGRRLAAFAPEAQPA